MGLKSVMKLNIADYNVQICLSHQVSSFFLLSNKFFISHSTKKELKSPQELIHKSGDVGGAVCVYNYEVLFPFSLFFSE